MVILYVIVLKIGKKSSLTDEYIFVKTIVYTPISITINGFHKNNC